MARVNEIVPLRFVVACLAMLASLLLASALRAAETRRPNIVLIMADDMGFECVAANGGTSYQTPNIDKLAAGGIRFTHCHSQPLCTPSRVQLMTGLYNVRNYIRFGLLDPKATTFGHVLKQAGYATCIVGKWQLGGGFEGPAHFGFDEYCLWQVTRRPNRYPNPGLEINGKEIDYTSGEYGPDIVNDYACSFIDRHKADDKPFFLYYPMMLTHWPFEPTPDSPDWNPKARLGDKAEKSGKGVDNKYFADMVPYCDKMVAKVIAKLDEAGLRDNTLVIFTGDNGTAVGITSQLNGRPMPGGKAHTTDNGTHVPLVVNWPGVVPAGRVNADLIDFSDFMPTLAEFAGATLPAGIPFDGHSFAPQLRGQAGSPRDWVYCWYERNGARGKEKQLVRNQRYKLYADGRMYDVVEDFFERSPLDPAALPPQARAAQAAFRPVLDQMATIEGPKPPAGKKAGKKNKKADR